jgi:hypothetical protein
VKIFVVHLHYSDVLHTPKYIAGSSTITLPVQPVWPFVLQVKCFYTFLCSVLLLRNYFYITVQEIRKFYCVILQPAVRLHYVYVDGIIVFKRTLGFPQFSHNQAYFSPIQLTTTHCDTPKMKIMKFLFKRRFYEFYFFCESLRQT